MRIPSEITVSVNGQTRSYLVFKRDEDSFTCCAEFANIDYSPFYGLRVCFQPIDHIINVGVYPSALFQLDWIKEKCNFVRGALEVLNSLVVIKKEKTDGKEN